MAAIALPAVLGFAPNLGAAAQEPTVLPQLSGVVLEADDRTRGAVARPVAGAAVSVVDGSGNVFAGRITDERGRYVIPGVPDGSYTIRVELIGYSPTEIPVRVAARSARLASEFVVRLTPQPIGIAGIVVTDQTEEHKPASLLAGDELAARLGETVAATLASEPGMAVSSMGPATEQPLIRGLGGDRVLVLEDGVRVSDVSGSSSDHAVALDPAAARRIEVLRGPSTLLFGPNALGGVINVVSDAIPTASVSRPFGSTTLQARSASDGWGGAGQMVFPVGDFPIRLEVTASTAGNVDTPLGPLANSQTETYGFSVGSAWFGESSLFGTAQRVYRNNYGVPGDPVRGHPNGVLIEMKRDATKTRALWNELGFLESLQLDAAYTWYRHWEIEPPDILGTFFQTRAAGLDALARHGEVGPLTKGAMGFRLGWEDFGFAGSMKTPNTGVVTAAAFAYEVVTLGRIDLEGGVRFDLARTDPGLDDPLSPIGHVRPRFFTVASGSLGAVLDLGGGKLGATVARAFRAPAVGELYSEGPHLAAYIYEVGNPELAPELGAGLDVYAGIEGRAAHLDIAAFVTRFENYIYSSNSGRVSPVQLPVYQFVGEDAELRGFEMSMEVGGAEGGYLRANASYVRGEIVGTREPLPLMPPLQARLGVGYEENGWFLGANAEMAARQERVARFETPTDGYRTVNLDLGARISLGGALHVVSAHVLNLEDRVYRNHLSRIKHLSPGPGRALRVVYRVVF